MTVGTLVLHLHIGEAATLKEKRRVVKSFRDRLRRAFNVSVGEVGALSALRSCRIGVGLVGINKQQVNSTLSKVVAFTERERDMSLVDYEMEIF